MPRVGARPAPSRFTRERRYKRSLVVQIALDLDGFLLRNSFGHDDLTDPDANRRWEAKSDIEVPLKRV
jgi:hypothetical protein